MERSETAQYAAAHRAYHLMKHSPAILEDTAALWLLAPPLGPVLRFPPLRWLFWRPLINKVGPISTFIVVRSRFAEDALAEAIQTGCRQYVMLGAGLDSWALRHTKEGVTAFELDHPATQAYKAERILARLGKMPPHLILIPIDFESRSVADVLPDGGLDTTSVAFVSWLGTIPYLTRDAIAATLTSLAEVCAPGSRLALDYFLPRTTMSPDDEALFDLLDRGGTERGEPMRSLLDVAEMAGMLTASGFRVLEDLSAADIHHRYLAGREDGLAVPGFVRLCLAERES